MVVGGVVAWMSKPRGKLADALAQVVLTFGDGVMLSSDLLGHCMLNM